MHDLGEQVVVSRAQDGQVYSSQRLVKDDGTKSGRDVLTRRSGSGRATATLGGLLALVLGAGSGCGGGGSKAVDAGAGHSGQAGGATATGGAGVGIGGVSGIGGAATGGAGGAASGGAATGGAGGAASGGAATGGAGGTAGKGLGGMVTGGVGGNAGKGSGGGLGGAGTAGKGSGGAATGGVGGTAGKEAATGGAGGSGPPYAIADFCQDFAAATCDWMVQCRSFAASSCPSNPGPLAMLRDFCSGPATMVAAVNAGRVTLDAAAVPACLAAVPNCALSQPVNSPRASCLPTLRGNVATGGACYPASSLFTDECAKGYCRRVQGACPGVCTLLHAVGESCSADLRCDATTAYCDGTTCRALAKAGASCLSPIKCAAGLNCTMPSTGTTDPICVILSAAGGPCQGHQYCQSPLACAGSVCAATVAIGQSCNQDSQCPSGARCLDTCFQPAVAGAVCDPTKASLACAEGLDCVQATSGAESRCAAPGALNAPCDSARIHACAAGLLCVSENLSLEGGPRKCVAPGDAGQACEDGSCASGLVCFFTSATSPGACTARGGAGTPCRETRPGGDVSLNNLVCAPNLYCVSDGACQAPGAVGGPCDARTTASCQAGLFCDATGKCRAPAALDQTCDHGWPRESTCTAGLYCACTTGCTCRPQIPDGTTCTESLACTSNYCNSTCQKRPTNCVGPN